VDHGIPFRVWHAMSFDDVSPSTDLLRFSRVPTPNAPASCCSAAVAAAAASFKFRPALIHGITDKQASLLLGLRAFGCSVPLDADPEALLIVTRMVGMS